ncbi:MAG: crossover junction endodeoxyribonuclease RuvC [Acidimicrobiales bacterium]
MFVLGVDPGLSRCGFAVVEPQRRGGRPVSIGVIRTDPDRPTPERLGEIAREIDDLIAEFRPAAVAVERIFFQNNVRTAVSVAQVSGIVMAAAVRSGAVVADYSPNQIKAAVTGDGRADKKQVQTMVQSLLGLNGLPKPADAADAAAIALCHLAHAPRVELRASASNSVSDEALSAEERR